MTFMARRKNGDLPSLVLGKTIHFARNTTGTFAWRMVRRILRSPDRPQRVDQYRRQ